MFNTHPRRLAGRRSAGALRAKLEPSFFTTIASLGTPYDITLHELRIESFFPADEATDALLRAL